MADSSVGGVGLACPPDREAPSPSLLSSPPSQTTGALVSPPDEAPSSLRKPALCLLCGTDDEADFGFGHRSRCAACRRRKNREYMQHIRDTAKRLPFPQCRRCFMLHPSAADGLCTLCEIELRKWAA